MEGAELRCLWLNLPAKVKVVMVLEELKLFAMLMAAVAEEEERERQQSGLFRWHCEAGDGEG